MIVELLQSGRSIKEVSSEYKLNDSMLLRWRREYEIKSGDFVKEGANSGTGRAKGSKKRITGN